MALIGATTLARVKDLLEIPTTATAADATLSTMILVVSAEIEQYIGRPLQVTARTEQYTMNMHGHSIWLRAYPIVSVSSIKVDRYWQFTSSAIASTRYNISEDTGRVYFLDTLIGMYRVTGWDTDAEDSIQVVYTGGIGSTTAAVITAAPAIAYACDVQVAEDYRRKNNPAVERRGGPSGGTTWTDSHRFLPRVQEMLYPHKRLVHGVSG